METRPNHMWRMVYVDYDGSQAQCLTCKEFFVADPNRVFKFCPACGIELREEFTKRNKRWGWLTFKRHFPIVEIWCLVDRYPNDDSFFGGFFNKKKSQPVQEWERYSSVYMSFNGFNFRKELLKYIECSSKRVDSPDKMKLILKTWNGKERTIYGPQLKAVFNRKYQKIDPPKPCTFACSGVAPDYFKFDSTLIESKVFMNTYKIGGF